MSTYTKKLRSRYNKRGTDVYNDNMKIKGESNKLILNIKTKTISQVTERLKKEKDLEANLHHFPPLKKKRTQRSSNASFKSSHCTNSEFDNNEGNRFLNEEHETYVKNEILDSEENIIDKRIVGGQLCQAAGENPINKSIELCSEGQFNSENHKSVIVDNENFSHGYGITLDINSARRPRMASLNAKAKVNAVLDCYKVDTRRDLPITKNENISHKKEKLIFKRTNKVDNDFDIPLESSLEVIDTIKDIPVIEDELKDIENNISDSDLLNNETIEQNDIKEKKSSLTFSEKSIQTDVYHKANQTDLNDTFLNKTHTICTCPKRKTKLEKENNYKNMKGKCPIHIKSSVLAHTDTHALAVPLVKKHLYLKDPKEQLFYSSFFNSVNVGQLQSNCISNVFLKHYPLNAKLMYIASENEKKRSKEVDKKNEKAKMATDKKNSVSKEKEKKLTVPGSQTPTATSPSGKAVNNKNKVVAGKNEIKEKKKINKSAKFEKTCNGWVFEGHQVKDTYKQGNQMICRTYFPTIRRDNEVINVQDAVILKSGHDSHESDYVARILQFWEDSAGIYAGEMMMSVLWYYKPEQMRSKCAEIIKCEEMELFASRHKDDNSVACIVEKCFVVSYSQFCRFRAQSQLVKEGRTCKDSLVPPNKTARSKCLPSPDISTKLVYFCRNAYDYRSGKLIKQG